MDALNDIKELRARMEDEIAHSREVRRTAEELARAAERLRDAIDRLPPETPE